MNILFVREFQSNRMDKGSDNTLEISINKEASLNNSIPEGDTPGGRLRSTRLGKHLLLVDLANLTGLSTRTLQLAEQNKTRLSPPNLRLLSRILEVPIAYLGCFETLPEDTLGKRIKKVRLYSGLTKREFATHFGLSDRMIQGWEKDEYLPNEKYMAKLKSFVNFLEEKIMSF